VADFLRFLGVEGALLIPFFYIATIWACRFGGVRPHDPRLVYLRMGAPLFLISLISFHSNVLPNWIAPSVLPLLAWRHTGTRAAAGRAGLSKAGLSPAGDWFRCIAFMHETDLIQISPADRCRER